MADFKAALRTYLTGQASLTALVGTRIYPDFAAPNATEPYVIYERIHLQDYAPTQAAASVLDWATYQLSIWGPTSLGVEAIVAVLRTLLDGYRGLMGSSVYVQSWRFIGAIDGLLEPDDGGIEARYRTTLTGNVWYLPA